MGAKELDDATIVRVRQAFREGTAREMREALGLRPWQLAALARLSSSSLRQWEAGKHLPRTG